jgi:hypothetical protein
MGNESDELKRQKHAAYMRAYRQQQKKLPKDEPKKARGRKPTDNPRRTRTIYLTDEDWAHCKAQPGGGSEYIQRLIAADRAQQKTVD